MNKLIPLIALALFILVGCDKEESNLNMVDNLLVEESSVWVMNTDGESPVWEVVALDELPSTQSSSSSASGASSRSNSVHMHGDFPGVEFSATVNNGGPHGGATLNLGPWSFTTETECIMDEDNEAVYGGTITERTGPPPFPGAPFNVGDHIYFKVIDNGQGNNAPADQFYGSIQFSPNSLCEASLDWGNAYDIPEPGSVKINN
jgi:hypothetical protein